MDEKSRKQLCFQPIKTVDQISACYLCGQLAIVQYVVDFGGPLCLPCAVSRGYEPDTKESDFL